jgi:virginiamycin B lyase
MRAAKLRSPRLTLEPLEDRRLLAAPVAEFAVPTANAFPEGISAGSDGALWFTEPGSANGPVDKIGRITTAGTITEFGGRAAGSLPGTITAGPDGNLWFVEPGANQIGRITTAGAVTEFPLPPGFNPNPSGITTGPDGALWFTETGAGRIGRITTAGQMTSFTTDDVPTSPQQITVGSDRNLWFTAPGTNAIGMITTAGAFKEFLIPTLRSSPQGITAGPDGALWFTELAGNKIGRIDPTTGAITEFAVPTSNSGPFGIVGAADGALWFTESNSGQIGRITTAGAITEQALPTGTSGPQGITAGPDGNLWFTESTADKVGTLVPIVPILSGSALTVRAFEGVPVSAQVAVFSDTIPQPATSYSAAINWGDGTSNAGTVVQVSGSFGVNGTHTYAIEGTYTISITISRNIGAAAALGTVSLNLTTTANVGGFVTSLYQTVLERAPDPGGLSFWLQQLRAGATHDQLAQAFWVSAEHRGLEVDQFYSTFLHRAADAAGRQAWVNDMLAGATEDDVAIAFLTSQEYTASHAAVASYVTGLYTDVLNRQPDAAGLSYWDQILQSGARARDAVAYYFLTSGEAYVQAINDYYRVFLGRTPSPAEQQNFLTALENGATPAEITSIFLSSSEFITREIALDTQGP